MKKIINIFLILFSVVLFQSCEDDQFESTLDYVTFSNTEYQSAIDPGSTAIKDIIVYSNNISSSDRVFNLSVDLDNTSGDSGSYTLPETVTIPANSNEGVFSIQLADVNLDCSNDLVFMLLPPEGITNGNSSTLTYYQKPSSSCASEVSGTLDFIFDDFASEISYEILDVEGNVVISGPDSSFSDGDTSTTIPVTLCLGRCYSLVVYDSFGDGLADPGEFSLTIDGTEYASGSGDFGDSDSSIFQVL